MNRNPGCFGAIVAFTVAGAIIWVLERAWPYLLAAFLAATVLAALLAARQRRGVPTLTVGAPTLRLTDLERERVAQTLRDACADGRLDAGELEERVAACYAAKRWADVKPLVADLGP